MPSKETRIVNSDGLLHNEEGPAVIWPDGVKEWYKLGKLHREDGPAKYSYDFEEWYKDGKLHRVDGSAITFRGDSSTRWYYEGELHRWNGPAFSNSYESRYYVHGKKVTKTELKRLFLILLGGTDE
jgi:hypothetical protein